MVVRPATRTLLSSQRANGWSAKSDRKLSRETFSGQGRTARTCCQSVALGGTSAMARLCPPEKAIVTTHRMG